MKVLPNNPETANLLFDICEAIQGIDLFNKSWKITNKGTISIEFTDKIKWVEVTENENKLK